MKPIALVVCATLALAACSQGENPDALFGNGAGTGPGGAGYDPSATSGTVIGPDGTPIEVNSIAYFNQIIGDRVLFPVDQSDLTAEAKQILDQQAAWLSARPSMAITIEGHADETGTREYNFRLSARRASSVRDYLVTRGIPDTRLSTIPFGKERPIATCSDEACWSRNRRAVTVVTGGLGV